MKMMEAAQLAAAGKLSPEPCNLCDDYPQLN